MQKIGLKLPYDVYEKFTALVKSENTTISQTIREMIVSYCDDTGVK